MSGTGVKAKTGLLGDLAGSVADFGTFVPLVVGVLAVRPFDPVGVLTGFGLFAIAVAVFYRRPVPIQPMKAVAALIVVGALTPGQAMASGLMIGVILLVLVASGAVGRIAKAVPGSIILGIQIGVGLELALIGLRHVGGDQRIGIGALAVLIGLYWTRWRSLSGIAVIAAAIAASVALGPGSGADWAGVFVFHPALPVCSWPTAADFKMAALGVLAPQLALTLSNAVLATSAIAAEYFPEGGNRMSPAQLAASTGVLNVVLAPFGALPMCHGSGGLVAQYGFGARTWVTPTLFGAYCLILGLGFGAGAAGVLALVPLGAVGAMLAVAGAEMAVNRRFLQSDPGCRVVVVATVAGCLGWNVAVGLVAGLLAEGIRVLYVRRHGPAQSGL